MRIQKRDGTKEDVDFNKITTRLSKLVNEFNGTIDVILVAQKVCTAIHDGMKTTEMDKLSSEIAISLTTTNPEYGTLAAYIIISDLHKRLSRMKFTDVISKQFESGQVTEEVHLIVTSNSELIQTQIDYNKDYSFDYFAIKTLEKSYLRKCDDDIIERPQDMFMRVAIGIYGADLDGAFDCYRGMTNKYYIHATPTLFNSGTNRPQMSSCFLLDIKSDSIEGIYETLSDCAKISKTAGGIGLAIHKIRSKGSSINKAKGACTGIVPMLKVFNDTARYVNQEGKRPGSIAAYLSVDHPDLMTFLEMKKNSGDEEERARDLFYAVWISDLFMKRVKSNETWSFFDPHQTPGLYLKYGKEYEDLYIKYENDGVYKKQLPAQQVWTAICNSQMETGVPYIAYKDAANIKNNQKNLGTLKSSNLCCEILEYTSPDEIAVCNLASICLPTFVNSEGHFDFDKLVEVSGQLTKNLNKVIDRNYYPVPEAAYSNFKNRPIGIGVQGLADVYMILGYPFDSPHAKKLNQQIFESIYYGAMQVSVELAQSLGAYESFAGSPLSEGKFQFDLWNVKPNMYNWDTLRDKVIKYGARNSLLVALMPTATTSQIMGNNECFEPYTSNIYLRRTLAGEFVCINRHLVKDLMKLNIWNQEIKNEIIKNNGSIQSIPNIPRDLKNLYKTVWEISQKALIDQAADRAPFVCQTQSMNLFIASPSVKIMSSMHFYVWEKGLKTGIYYLRTQPAAKAQQFTIDVCESCSA
mgnify:FL=1